MDTARMVESIRYRILTAALLAVFFASSAAAQQAVTFLGLTFPAKIAGTQIGETTDYEKVQKGAGYGVEYRRSGWKINSYIYDLGLPAIPDDPLSEPVKQAFEGAKQEILRVPSYANARVTSSYVLTDARLKPRFVCATANYSRKDMGEVDSVLCVAGWKNKFVKFRVTAPRRAGSEAEAKRFVEAWIDILWPS